MYDTTNNQLAIEMSGMINQPQLPDSPPQQYISPYNHPRGGLDFQKRRRDYIDIFVPLYRASVVGDWEAVKTILDDNREFEDLLGYSITEDKETTLHNATLSQNVKLVEHLVDRMTDQQLALQNKQGMTAVSFAAGFGNVDIARVMVQRYPQLLKIRDEGDLLPINMAALFGNREMVAYLYDENKTLECDDLTCDDIQTVLWQCIQADLFDSALEILNQNKEIGFPEQWYAQKVLDILAGKTYAFKDKKSWKNPITWVTVRPAIKESVATELLREIWKRILERPNDEIDDILGGSYPFQILFLAAEMGNTKFLVELIHGYPDLMWKTNDDQQNIFHIAVSHRHESIYNLIYEMGSFYNIVTRLTDKHGNNMLHLVGMKAKRNPNEDETGAAFQLQRELLWFKEVSSTVPCYSREEKNDDGSTPLELFIKNHEEMVSKGEKWMKGTANQCMVVAALITTVVFSVAFTIPGGYDQNDGFPIFLKDGPFIMFVILDAISLILSSASILMFLSILTSRYAQDDFLVALPKKLMIGLTTLFLSIITMMVAFAISFFVLYRNKFILVPIIIGAIAIVPIFLYVKLQFPLLIDVYRSTYGSRYLFRPKKRVLFYRNPRF